MNHILVALLTLTSTPYPLNHLSTKISLSQYIAYETLANKPFELPPQKLTPSEEHTLLNSIPDWHIDRIDIHRLKNNFTIKSTSRRIEFINYIKNLAYETKLYMEVIVFGPSVYVELYNPYIGGLSQNEFILAARITMLYSIFYRT